MKAVIYARYSPGPQQREESIEGQIRECTEFAQKQELTIVGQYVDRAATGRNDNRIEFQKMLKDSEKRLFDAVVVWKIDRFGRSREEIAANKVRLRRNGVKVLYAKEHIPDGPEGIILESLLEGLAEYYSANLSQNIKRGMQENALKGLVTGGNVALGYRINKDKKFEIDPFTAPIVKEIFTLYDAGYTAAEINKHLNNKGYKTSRGVPFNKNSFGTILKNKKYIGVYTFDGQETGAAVPAIISEDLFYRVQAKLIKNKKAPGRGKAKVDYLLSTKLFCGHCGSAMVGESGAGRGKVYHYYKCIKRKREKACGKVPVAKDWIEDLVIRETINTVLTDEVITLISENIEAIQRKEQRDNPVAYLQDKLKENEKAAKNLLKAIEQGVLTPTTKSRMKELEHEKAELLATITQEQTARVFVTKEQARYWLEQFRSGEINDPEYRRRLVDTFINAVFLYDPQDDDGNKKIIITFNYTGGTQTVNISDLTPPPPPNNLPSIDKK
ncbi:MAG: recombinase family protein [Firmicutes bacterium]|nr:recombinase family protein [Bacillota bacterium]